MTAASEKLHLNTRQTSGPAVQIQHILIHNTWNNLFETSLPEELSLSKITVLVLTEGKENA